jgi:ABC-2 type transport system ATP-binding protein
MTAVMETHALGKRYRRWWATAKWALAECTLAVPGGHVVGLVGPNGAGKSTLLNLAVGLIAPTTGTVRLFGASPVGRRAPLSRLGFVAQDAPLYARLTVAEHLAMGAHLNTGGGWDARAARERIAALGLPLAARAATLSGGQRAQLALTMAVAKRPELLILDEPVASLDPLARREFLDYLATAVAEYRMSVVLSSHLVSDLARICDYLIVLHDSRVQVAGPITDLLAAHRASTGAPVELEDFVLEQLSRARTSNGVVA